MEEEVKYTSEFDGQTTDEVLKHAKSVKDLTIPSLSNISGFVCIDNEGKAIGMISKEQVAQVVGGLIGRASEEKAGLVYADMFSFGRNCADANEEVTFGSFRLEPSTDNVPSGINYGDVLLVLPWDTNTVFQFIYTVSGNEYRRIKSVTWGEWNLL